MIKTTFKIEGMGCGMCETHINHAIRTVYPDAKKVKSSYRKGETTFITDFYPDELKLQKAIGKTGYKILSVKTEIVEDTKHFWQRG
ncbi:MAG: heavy-metal-associated domain-containing protein [Clostridia bacterium]|nr:heavy-metal-associated domain-containing protein [Clostridia bacterium]